jgi:hypothetical protein
MAATELWRVRLFEAKLSNQAWGLLLVVPPVGYWALVQFVAATTTGVPASVWPLVGLMSLATLLPFGALAWMLCSVAAYTVRPGAIVEHRVVRDREFPLKDSAEARLVGGVVLVPLHGKTLRLRVADAEECREWINRSR